MLRRVVGGESEASKFTFTKNTKLHILVRLLEAISLSVILAVLFRYSE